MLRSEELRLDTGGVIDRQQIINFSFNGQSLQGFSGDTVASALAANAVRLLARSFKYHRPRGLYSAGPEEPNALLSIDIDGRVEVNARATMVQLREGMKLRSQNCYPSVNFDLGAVNDKLSPLLSAGFYYKTFIWPGLKGWMFYENIIRKAAGMGETGLTPDNAKYEHLHLHCDLLVVGAGIAGISTALAAATNGLDVVLVEQHQVLGGQARDQSWLKNVTGQIEAHPKITLLRQTTAFGAYDNKVYTLLEKTAAPCSVLERLYEVKAAQCVTATGALERPIVFSNNDLPGIQLAGAAQLYLHRFSVLPGRKIAIFCNNSSAYQVAQDLLAVGANLVAIIDSRSSEQVTIDDSLQKLLVERGVTQHFNAVVSNAVGGKQLRAIAVNQYLAASQEAANQDNAPREKVEKGKLAQSLGSIDCDSLLVSGGWSPTAHLHSQAGGKLTYDHQLAALVPVEGSSDIHCVGAAAGDFQAQSSAKHGWQLGCQLSGCESSSENDASNIDPACLALDSSEFKQDQQQYHIQALWSVPEGSKHLGKAFVDLQHDVSKADIELAAREGYQSVEHLKRYTTLGMATDQGKLSNVNALALMAEQLGQSIDQTGTTKFRPPFTPVTVGAWGGNETEQHLTPTRRTPMQQWHEANGGNFNISGAWRRATDYRNDGENKRQATIREACHVRAKAGIVDVSSLGKIRVCGPDALQLLNLVYVNSLDTLKINRARYAVMLREDGMVFDDGTVIRLASNDYLITTTTANAALVLRHLDRLSQVDWPELQVACTSVTDQYAAMAIAGPLSREILQSCIADIDFSDETLPFMGYSKGHLGEIPVEVCRISFSGELAYELYTAADFGAACWQMLLDHNPSLKVYGLDALDTLRIEKGHLTGAEIDGRRTLDDIGMAAMDRGKKPYIGQVLSKRSGLQENRLQIVGLRSVDPSQILEEGMHLVEEEVDLFNKDCAQHHPSLGQLSSVCYSPVIGGEIGLAQLRDGRNRIGDKLWAISPLRDLRVEVAVTHSCFYDIDNKIPRTPAQHLKRPESAVSFAPLRRSTLNLSTERMNDIIGSDIADHIALFSISSWPKANAQRIEALASLLGFAASDYPNVGESLRCSEGKYSGVTIYAVGPYQCWLEVATDIASASQNSTLNIDQILHQISAEIASVVDISHSYSKVQLRGKQLRELLRRAIDIDLRCGSFSNGQCALTRLLGVQSLVHCNTAENDQVDQFELFFNRSFALDAWQHLSQLSHNLRAID